MGVQARTLLLRLILIAGAAYSIYFGATDLSVLAGAISSHDALIVFWPKSAVGPPLAVVFLALTVMTFSPTPPAGPTPRTKAARAAAGRPGFAGWCLAVALVCIPVVILAPPVAASAVGSRLAALGYARCPPIFEGVRKLRWALPTPQAALGRCPTHGS